MRREGKGSVILNLTDKIKHKGLELGFTHVGITTAEDFVEYEKELISRPDYEIWHTTDLSKYPGRSNMRIAARPQSYYPQGKSIICATYGYSQFNYPPELTQSVARAYLCRAYVPLADSAAGIRVAEFRRYIHSLGIDVYDGKHELPERVACARAGIITFGKNNFAYTKEDGSFNILYTFLVDTELEYNEPTMRCDCPENCHKCIDACPSKALLKPGRLYPCNCAMNNHQLAVSDIPEDLWDKFGFRIHGCDECQLACPRNQAVLKKATRCDMLLEELKSQFDMEKVLLMDEEYYENVIKPMMYNYIRNMDIFRRNAAIALGNSGNSQHISALKKAFAYGNPELDKVLNWAIEKLSDKMI